MKGKRNEAFFQNRQASSSSKSLSTLYRAARETGALILSSKGIQTIPHEIFNLESHAEEGEKFWEMSPLMKLDLSHNRIQEIPPDISNLQDLVSLQMRGNRISTLPSVLCACRMLKHLDLSSNEICVSEHMTSSLSDLQECLLGENKLTDYPSFLSDSRDLKVLDLNSNFLSHVPHDICNLRGLVRISLKNNKLIELPASLGGSLTRLTMLDVRKNRISTLPDLSGMCALQLLDAGENALVEMPVLPKNGQLGRLHLDCNSIRVIDMHSLDKCSGSLFELHLHDNKLSNLPDEVAKMSSLKVLDIANNDIGDLPATIGYMESLQRVAVEGNPIRSIRRTLLSQSTADLKKYLRTRGPPLSGVGGTCGDEMGNEGLDSKGATPEVVARLRDIGGGVLDLSGLRISTMPSGWIPMVERARNIDSMEVSVPVASINLSKNEFRCIPGDIIHHSLPSLTSLNISNNRLGDCPAVDFFCFGDEDNCTRPSSVPPNLKDLSVSSNSLSTDHLERILTSFTSHSVRGFSLLRLDASRNSIATGPTSISLHNGLRELHLAFNRLTSLTNIDFSRLNHLEVVDLSNNRLTSLGCIYDASALRSLLLENNEIDAVPLELCRLQCLTTLTLHGNPQRTVRQATLQKGTDAILAALRSKMPETVFKSGSTAISDSDKAQQHDSGGLSCDQIKMQELQVHIANIERRLEQESLSEANRYALKKEIAKARANIMRIKRSAT